MDKEIILIVGYPASGKSSLAETYVKNGYYRLNKDAFGGSLKDINQRLEEMIVTGTKRFVLDNEYPTVSSRRPVIAIGEKYKIPVKCVVLSTSIENSQYNAVVRIIKKKGYLMMPDEIAKSTDPDIIAAGDIFNFRRKYEKPEETEGYSEVITQRFSRKRRLGYTNRALFFDLDSAIRTNKSGRKVPTSKEDIEILPGRQGALSDWKARGYMLIGISNQNAVGKDRLSDHDVKAYFEHTNELLGGIIDEMAYCPHDSYPIQCYCKKPMPGLGVFFTEKYKLDPYQCYMIVGETADSTFAKRCGFEPIDAQEVFEEYENFVSNQVYKQH